jgi:hypothetical protein
VRGAHDAFLVLADTGGAQAGGLDILLHAMQYNCNIAVLLHRQRIIGGIP